MIEYVPLSRFSAYHKEGWKLVPGYDLKAGDYAAVMQSPGHDIKAMSNKQAACWSRIDSSRLATVEECEDQAGTGPLVKPKTP